MKKKLALLLALVMVLALVFVGCDKNKDDDDDDADTATTTVTTADSGNDDPTDPDPVDPPSTEELIVGKWSAMVDFTELAVGEMDEEMKSYFDFDAFELKVIYEFKADKTYAFSMDKAVTEAGVDKFLDEYMRGFEAYITDLLEESGYDMTFADYMVQALSMTADEFKAELRVEMLATFENTGEGTYTVDDDTILLTETGVDEKTTFTYDDGELELVRLESDDYSEETEIMNDILGGTIFKK